MDFIHTLFGEDLKAGLSIILNLIIIESLLSIDNAAVLATMVGNLPEKDKPKALKYGIWGAFLLRGLCLFIASWLVKIWWLKFLGGAYLIYLCLAHFSKKFTSVEEVTEAKPVKPLIIFGVHISPLVSTIIMIEIMDLAFSLDNVFAAVAFTDHLGLICTGVFIGIIAMRFVAQAFVKLMEKFTFLENIAYIVIGVLGIKLAVTIATHFYPQSGFTKLMDSEHTDMFVSIFTIGIFLLPVLSSLLFNYPKKVIIPVKTPVTSAATTAVDDARL